MKEEVEMRGGREIEVGQEVGRRKELGKEEKKEGR